MRAVVYTRYGPPDVLQVAERDKPVPGDDELLVRVEAVEATKADCELRSFNFPVKWFALPLRLALGVTRPRRQILGGYFAGVVEQIGKDVVDFEVGHEVFGAVGLGMGAYAEHMAVSALGCVAPKPTNMSFAEAAAVPLGGLNALHFLKLAAIQRGESVLINGAGGSIGLFGVQLAKLAGAELTVVDSDVKEELLRGAGVDEFLDYGQVDFTQTGDRYDVIFDMVAGSSYAACLGALKPNGRYVTGNPTLSKMLRSPLTNVFTDKRVIFKFASERRAELLELKQLIERGDLTATLDRVFALEDAADAHRRVEREERLGAVVLSPTKR